MGSLFYVLETTKELYYGGSLIDSVISDIKVK